MDIKLTDQGIWQSTLIFGLAGILLLIPLLFLYRNTAFQRSAIAASVASGIFWGILAILAIKLAWDLYYQYLYPSWMRWLSPADALVYAAFGLGLWWLATRLPGPAVLWFVLLGGLEGILEHVFGIYGLRILDKVPWLNGVSPLPVIIFSFFEYILYWDLVAWLGLGIRRLAGLP